MSEVDAYLARLVDDEEIPGAVWVVAGNDGVIAEGAVGDAVRTAGEQVPVTPDTIYDLASLTKPLITSFLYLLMERELGLDRGDPAGRFFSEFGRMDKRDILIGHLLTHTSGLAGWIPFYLAGRTAAEYVAQLEDRALEHRPGTRVVYSDPGYIVLGELLQRCATTGLDRLARTMIFEPLGLTSTGFNPPGDWIPRVAATEDSCQYERMLAGPESANYGGFRDGLIRGEVHDQNAWALGGVAGHAGLFATARETAMIAAEYLGSGRGLLDGRQIDLARSNLTEGLNEARTGAFRMASVGETAAGPALSDEAIGHNGFTGTSLWLDPPRGRLYVLLTNRVHPRVRDSVDMMAVRQSFHSLASKI